MTDKSLSVQLQDSLQSEKIRQRIVASLGEKFVDRFIFAVVKAAQQTPRIHECSALSKMSAILACAELRLMPNTASHHAYLIPFKGELTLQVGYKGFIELAGRAEFIVTAEAVYDGDFLSFEYGTSPFLKHVPDFSVARTKEKMTHVYAIASKGTLKWFVVLPKADVDRVRISTTKKNGAYSPWESWYEEMAKKTAIKRMLKLMPITPEISYAHDLDGKAEMGEPADNYEDADAISGHQEAAGGKIDQYVGAIMKEIYDTEPEETERVAQIKHQIKKMGEQPAIPKDALIQMQNAFISKFGMEATDEK